MKNQSSQKLYAIYITDTYLSTDSKQIIMVTDNLSKATDILKNDNENPMTDKQITQLLENKQTQCSDVEYEWIVEEIKLNQVLI